ncbi:muscle M-line assembly protein unc-89-like isoform X1 [Gadus chalcogrammus]|uniref:muscle M-line assembly protein unc-89-like isoform X1 n=1 Tax=Gadus chalcogrammus TaxID=1042646 RepID=UPI0024C341F8|nr:muscle M-line assembly protein unc-89-like isoform X1 [Gadus chalcogrammus]
MKMNPRTLSVLLLLAGPLGADPDRHVEYPDSFCVVEGSTATIPCSFTHPAVHKDTGVVVERVERVVWCPNHPICHLTTPNVYDSSNVRANSRFLYLGDLVRNCTLKIIKTVKQDAATYRFRFETNGGGYTGLKGVRVKVTNGEVVKVRSSVTDHVVKEGGQVTLTCTSACSFHQLDVHWYRNGHALSETGPALHLSSLTNDNTGNYTCSLDSSGQKTSAPWSLAVLEDEGKYKSDSDWRLTVSVVLKVLWAVFLLLLAGLVFTKRSAPGPEHEIVYSEVVG